MSGTNPIASWSLPVNTTDMASTYKAKLDGDFAVAQRLVDNFAPTQSSPAAMTVTLDAGHYFIGTTLTEVASQTTGTITAPVSHPRIDRVVVNSSGTVSVITGTPASSPSPPAITAGNFPVAQVLIQTTSTSIVNSMITDERALEGLNVAASTVPYGSIGGCIISGITGSHTTAACSVGAGNCADSTGASFIVSAGYSWAASNGNAINGTDASSSTLANSTTYHMFLCSGASGTGTFVSASLTPTFPSGYTTYKRRIGSFNTDVSGAPLPYTSIEINGGGTINWLATQVLDITVNNLGTSRTLYTLGSVPSGVKMQPLYRANDFNSGSVILTSGDETDVAPASNTWQNAPGADIAPVTAGQSASFARDGFITTNTSGQIGARASATGQNFYWVTRGWLDFRKA